MTVIEEIKEIHGKRMLDGDLRMFLSILIIPPFGESRNIGRDTRNQYRTGYNWLHLCS